FPDTPPVPVRIGLRVRRVVSELGGCRANRPIPVIHQPDGQIPVPVEVLMDLVTAVHLATLIPPVPVGVVERDDVTVNVNVLVPHIESSCTNTFPTPLVITQLVLTHLEQIGRAHV